MKMDSSNLSHPLSEGEQIEILGREQPSNPAKLEVGLEVQHGTGLSTYVATAQPLAVSSQYVAQEINGIQRGQWEAGLCDCVGSCSNCLMSFFCPCFQLAGIAARIGEYNYEHVLGFTLVCFILCYVSGVLSFIGALGLIATIMVLRQRIRKVFEIPGSECDDCCAATFCGACVIAQMATHVHSYSPGAGCSFKAPPIIAGLPMHQLPQTVVANQPHATQPPLVSPVSVPQGSCSIPQSAPVVAVV
jgi:Cys-rich protein (TIGR01571 family)